MAYRILIVDDEIALQNMVKEILIQAGYETAPALSCAQALEPRWNGLPMVILCRRFFGRAWLFTVCRRRSAAVLSAENFPILFSL